ncbi:hypothetical protein [Paenibacillus odorifer]|uniref:hypothetical protein n=1 Tax=Paenibacillus odorifer TaxID=189426 RepID=UPI00096E0E11|nr:hypothetical protein [Paenibacillus odorifer]OMD16248.1 hypothetical protein BJP50_18600 [Paenibacillus odorifer]
MTKLNVVIPAVNVMVEVGGSNVEFRKVDRKAQAGDIVKALVNSLDVEAGAFYEIVSDKHGAADFLDDAGDVNGRADTDGYPEEFEVYEAVAPVTAESSAESSDEITFENARYRKVNRSAREGDVVKCVSYDYDMTYGGLYAVIAGPGVVDDVNDFCAPFENYPEDFVVYEKVSVPSTPTYREVKRKAAVGERIKIVDAWGACGAYSNGAEFTVDTVRGSKVYVNSVSAPGNSSGFIDSCEYVVLEPVNAQVKAEPSAQPKHLTVGDYAKVTDASGDDRAKLGDIVKVTGFAAWDAKLLQAETTDGRAYAMFSYRFTPATAEEVSAAQAAAQAEAQRKAEEAQETAKWAKINRKVGEFKRGDIVEVTDISGLAVGGKIKRGDIVTLGAKDESDGMFRLQAPGVVGGNWASTQRFNLVTPVEKRFDTQSAA